MTRPQRPTKIPTVQELAEHARSIARAFNIHLEEGTEYSPEPHLASAVLLDYSFLDPSLVMRGVFVQPITNECMYAITMHELGHHCAPNGQIITRPVRRKDGTVVQKEDRLMNIVAERAAWEWAEHYALDWTTAMEQAKVFGLATYEKSHARYLREDAQAKRAEANRAQELHNWTRRILK